MVTLPFSIEEIVGSFGPLKTAPFAGFIPPKALAETRKRVVIKSTQIFHIVIAMNIFLQKIVSSQSRLN